MEFSEFAEILKPIIGGSYSTHRFTKTLFETLLTDEGLFQIEGISENTYKAYFNGNTKITKIAQKIFPYIEPEQMVDYLNSFSDAIAQDLMDSFAPYIENITPMNVAEEVTYFLVDIIKSAASEKKKSPTGAGDESERVEADVVDDGSTSDSDARVEKNNVIQNQVNVVQNGNNNMNLTNTGTINFYFGGSK